MPEFGTALQASSYHHPDGNEAYARLRQNIVQQATAMGYEYETMFEHPVSWGDDQDPFKHVTTSSYTRYFVNAGIRFFESFQGSLKDKFKEFMNAEGIGIVVRHYTADIRRPVKYPDSVIVGIRPIEVFTNRVLITITMWSLQQQAIVANFHVIVAFADHRKGRPVDLLKEGGVYKDLHADLVCRAAKCNKIASEWEEKKREKKKSRQAQL